MMIGERHGLRDLAMRRSAWGIEGRKYPGDETPGPRGEFAHSPGQRGTSTMRLPRRSFLRTTLGAGVLAASARRGTADEERRSTNERLDEVAAAQVLRI